MQLTESSGAFKKAMTKCDLRFSLNGVEFGYLVNSIESGMVLSGSSRLFWAALDENTLLSKLEVTNWFGSLKVARQLSVCLTKTGKLLSGFSLHQFLLFDFPLKFDQNLVDKFKNKKKLVDKRWKWFWQLIRPRSRWTARHSAAYETEDV